MLIYKILRPAEWEKLRADGQSSGAPVDVADGFVHFSTAAQLAETLKLHFAGAGDLELLAVPVDNLGAALKWERSRGGDQFPHLFAPLRLADIAWHQPVFEEPGGHILPGAVV